MYSVKDYSITHNSHSDNNIGKHNLDYNKQVQSSQCLSTILLLLLGGNTHRLAETARGLGVLSTHLQVPVVTQTAVRSTHHHPANAFYLIFFRRFRSSRRLAWRLLETTWRYFPVSTSFCLFRNHSGISN